MLHIFFAIERAVDLLMQNKQPDQQMIDLFENNKPIVEKLDIRLYIRLQEKLTTLINFLEKSLINDVAIDLLLNMFGSEEQKEKL